MEPTITKEDLLSHFVCPAFYGEEGIITHVNDAASRLLITAGTPVSDYLASGREEYAGFSCGCLYLTLKLQDRLYSACVTREKGQDLIIAEQDQLSASLLQAYALAARELREPLASVMLATERLFRTLPQDADPVIQRQAAFINQNLYRMLRILGNMSDASRFADGMDVHIEQCSISSVLAELFADIQDNCRSSGIDFSYRCPEENISGPIDRVKLERGIYNLISNAIKFSDKKGAVRAEVKRRGARLYITITGSGEGIAPDIQNTIYRRYQRGAGLEESRQGIGLGMVLARGAAAIHGGTLLMETIDHETRITMTLSLEGREMTLRSPVLRVDYTGEKSHSLVELSDCLAAELYSIENLK